MSGVRSGRLARTAEIAVPDRVVLHAYGFNHERAIGGRVLTLYAAITDKSGRLARRQPAVFLSIIRIVTPTGEMSVQLSAHRRKATST
jgi:hypothetical protein